MRNDSNMDKICRLINGLPYFTIDNLKITEMKTWHLRIILSRLFKRGEIIRIKKKFYVSQSYIDEISSKGLMNIYLEFLSGVIYSHSYLSLDYALYENNLITELPKNFSSVSLHKTAVFSNKLGTFLYHKIRRNLFVGYRIQKEKGFIVYKASKAKALFDFLYFRKNLLLDKESVNELRINSSNLNKSDIKEFKQYIMLEGSNKMKAISNWLLD